MTVVPIASPSSILSADWAFRRLVLLLLYHAGGMLGVRLVNE